MSKKRTTAHLRTPFYYFQLTNRALTVPLHLPSRLHGDRSPYYSFVVSTHCTRPSVVCFGHAFIFHRKLDHTTLVGILAYFHISMYMRHLQICANARTALHAHVAQNNCKVGRISLCGITIVIKKI